MASIEELQNRMSKALQRIGAVSETLSANETRQFDEEQNLAALTQLEDALYVSQNALKAEQRTTQKLRERVAKLEAQIAQNDAVKHDQSVQRNSAIEELDNELVRLREASQDLRQSLSALRAEQEARLATSETIDQSMKAELTALQAERAADTAEVNAILTALEPLVSENSADDRKEEGNA